MGKDGASYEQSMTRCVDRTPDGELNDGCYTDRSTKRLQSSLEFPPKQIIQHATSQ